MQPKEAIERLKLYAIYNSEKEQYWDFELHSQTDYLDLSWTNCWSSMFDFDCFTSVKDQATVVKSYLEQRKDYVDLDIIEISCSISSSWEGTKQLKKKIAELEGFIEELWTTKKIFDVELNESLKEGFKQILEDHLKHYRDKLEQKERDSK